jgi:dipeptidyl-peptidase-4
MHSSVRFAATLSAFFVALSLQAQDRLKTMPEYERFRKSMAVMNEAGKTTRDGNVWGTWVDSGKAFEYQRGDSLARFDVATGRTTTVPPRRMLPGDYVPGPLRGHQYASAMSPTKTHKALYKNRNLWIGDSAGNNPIQITTDGDEAARVKNASAPWVYGEELYQNTAMWWSPSGRKIAFYRFDESPVPDY